jgi:glycosyltransferase involved in cell wall biosynthesis
MVKNRLVKKLSVVVPLYNEADGIGIFFGMLDKELKKLSVDSYEVVMVNDGSKDDSAAVLEKLEAVNSGTLVVLELTRNFGKEAALSAGLHIAEGDCVVTLDADGQHPPGKISEFLDVYAEGYDMVVGVRTDNMDERLLKKAGNKAYYRLLKSAGISHLQPRVTDFRAMSRAAVDEFCKLTERRRITRGLLDWMGFNTAYVEFKAPERLAGTATYSMKKLMYLAVDSILSNSRKPLAVSVVLGGFITSLGLLGTLFILIENYVLSDPLNMNFSGTALIASITLFMVGIILISQGVSSLYLARIYEEAQQRPLYIVNHSKSTKRKSPRT